MSKKKRASARPSDAQLEREIRVGRKFSLADAIGRIGGSDLLKGASPVTRKRQAALQIEQFLERHLVDSEGALLAVLLRRVRDSSSLMKSGYDEPLVALAIFCRRILGSEALLQSFVHEVDVEWGRMYDELPHFQREGRPPNSEDPYSFSSVRTSLSQLLEQLPRDTP